MSLRKAVLKKWEECDGINVLHYLPISNNTTSNVVPFDCTLIFSGVYGAISIDPHSIRHEDLYQGCEKDMEMEEII